MILCHDKYIIIVTKKQPRQLIGAKARLGQQMDSLDIVDKFYEKKEFLNSFCGTGGHLRAGAVGWQISEAHKVPISGVFWRQGAAEYESFTWNNKPFKGETLFKSIKRV